MKKNFGALIFSSLIFISPISKALDVQDIYLSVSVGEQVTYVQAFNTELLAGVGIFDFWGVGTFLERQDSAGTWLGYRSGVELRFSAEPWELYSRAGIYALDPGNVFVNFGGDYLVALTPAIAAKGGLRFEPTFKGAPGALSFELGTRLLF